MSILGIISQSSVEPSVNDLGSLFLSCIETGRFKYWTGEDQPLQDGWWFYRQAEACTYHIPPGGQFDKHLQWGVPASAKISTPYGLADASTSAQANARALAIHDDRLISAALIA
ncbi:MAG TPA: hypothetical protein VLE70_07060, partial [Anaerolineae bacterium]|nr:hypothetical protein [Anaerolineae bacterium]